MRAALIVGGLSQDRPFIAASLHGSVAWTTPNGTANIWSLNPHVVADADTLAPDPKRYPRM